MNNMKNLVIGILAHVDAGKTTCIEGMLYRSGTIRKMGRVDHGDAYLDYDEQERDHGITIYSKDRAFLVSDIVTVIAQYRATMLSVNIVANRDDLTATALIGLVVDSKDHLETIMANLRKPLGDFADEAFQTAGRIDYENDDTGLPKSDVLSFALANGCKIIVRPSGTEPKLKAYLFAKGVDQAAAEATLDVLEALMNRYCKA